MQDVQFLPPSEQNVLSFNRFHASFSKCLVLSKPYYHKSFDKPPSKSILHANLCETVEELNNMPFSVVCGELLVYSLLVELLL